VRREQTEHDPRRMDKTTAATDHLYLPRLVWLFVPHTSSYLVDYFGLQDISGVLILPLHGRQGGADLASSAHGPTAAGLDLCHLVLACAVLVFVASGCSNRITPFTRVNILRDASMPIVTRLFAAPRIRPAMPANPRP